MKLCCRCRGSLCATTCVYDWSLKEDRERACYYAQESHLAYVYVLNCYKNSPYSVFQPQL